MVIADAEQGGKLEQFVHRGEDDCNIVKAAASLILHLQFCSTIISPRDVELADLVSIEGVNSEFLAVPNLMNLECDALVHELTICISLGLGMDVDLLLLVVEEVEALEADARAAGLGLAANNLSCDPLDFCLVAGSIAHFRNWFFNLD